MIIKTWYNPLTSYVGREGAMPPQINGHRLEVVAVRGSQARGKAVAQGDI
jgi:hypothetical protein